MFSKFCQTRSPLWKLYCPCVASAMFMCKDKINAFSVSKHKGGNVFVYVFELLVFFLKIQSKLEVCIYRTLWKGFGNTQEEKMFFISFLSVKLECIYFWCGFLSMGGLCFLLFISKTVGWLLVLLMYYSGVFWNNKFFGVLGWTHCWKSVDIVVVMAIYDNYYDW